jgi:hypothetical protein
MTTNGHGELGIFGSTDAIDEMGNAAPEADAIGPDAIDDSGNLTAERESLLRRRTALANQIATLEQVMEPMNRNEHGRAQMPPHWPLELKRMKQEVAFIDKALTSPNAQADMQAVEEHKRVLDDLHAARRARKIADDTLSHLSGADLDDLRDFIPPPSPVGGRDPFARPLRPGPGYRRRRPRRDGGLLRHLMRRVMFYAVTFGEIALDELKQIQMNLDVTADDLDECNLDPDLYPTGWQWSSPNVMDDYPELQRDGEGLAGGVFKGGIGR